MKLSLSPALLATLSCVATLASCSLSWESCGQPEDLLDIRSIQYTPENPQRGDVLNVTALGLLKEPLAQGTKINLLVKWGYIRVPVPAVDLCAELAKKPDSDYQCPLASGDFDLKQSFQLPKEMPQGDYDVTIKIKSQDQRQVACVKVLLSV